VLTRHCLQPHHLHHSNNKEAMDEASSSTVPKRVFAKQHQNQQSNTLRCTISRAGHEYAISFLKLGSHKEKRWQQSMRKNFKITIQYQFKQSN
jgi:hypothetical protein